MAGLFELSLVFGSLLAFLIWQLISVQRSQSRDRERKRAAGDDADA